VGLVPLIEKFTAEHRQVNLAARCTPPTMRCAQHAARQP
jgi:hypothetical protein